MAEMSRDTEIKGIWARYGWFYRLLRGAVLIGVGVLVGMIIYAEPQVRADYVMNLFVTALSLGATALIFDELNRKRSVDDLKRQLVDDAASLSHEIAVNAVHQIKRRGWLDGENGLLRGADLDGANLYGVLLGGANLQGAHFGEADLQGAHLWGTNLQGAYLGEANLQGADLLGAKLNRAFLHETNLQGADLRTSQLQGAHLLDANLRGANLLLADLRGAHLGWNARRGTITFLSHAKFDEHTTLPDGRAWTPETDMCCFTDPDHPDFYPVSDKVEDFLESLT